MRREGLRRHAKLVVGSAHVNEQLAGRAFIALIEVSLVAFYEKIECQLKVALPKMDDADVLNRERNLLCVM